MNMMRSTLLLSAAAALATGNSSPGLLRSDVGDVLWNQAMARAQELIGQMTNEELNNLTYGFTVPTGCSGQSGSIGRLQFPGLCLHDGPAGAKGHLVTGFASGVSVAASFNEDLAYQRALYMGAEFKRKGVQAVNGPVTNPLGRTATSGRPWEGFGVDSYLNGKLAAQTVKGIQKSAIAVVKHYIANEQETKRYSLQGQAVSSDVDDATMHEVYVAPFQDAIFAGAAGIMCSYQRINSTYACENERTLNQILKDELNFPGFVVSDWVFGQKSGLPSAKGGLDLAMPNSAFWGNGSLAKSVGSGELAKERLQDMAKRILASWFLITPPGSGSDRPGFGLPADISTTTEMVDARDPASRESTKRSAIEGHVLVKNTNKALPWTKPPKILSLFGWDGRVGATYNPDNSPYGRYKLGLDNINASESVLLGALAGNQPDVVPQIAALGTLIVGGGSGSNNPSYTSDAYSALSARAAEDQTYLFWDFSSLSPGVVQSSSACLVLLNQFSSEALDRQHLSDEEGDKLVLHVASKCTNTIVVIHNAWIRVVDAWIEHPNVTAVVYAHLPGQDSGSALVDLLYGRESFSGRLPYTVAKNESDYGNLLLPASKNTSDGGPHAVFSEGNAIDYRHFLSKKIAPRFAFGFGLSYSTFGYNSLRVDWLRSADRATSPPNPSTVVPGGIKSLFDTIAEARVTVQNTGDVTAAEVAQLYVQFPGDKDTRYLRGFSKLGLQPGESRQASFPLTRRDLSRWNVLTQQWELQTGEYVFYAGKDVEEAAGRSVVLQA